MPNPPSKTPSIRQLPQATSIVNETLNYLHISMAINENLNG